MTHTYLYLSLVPESLVASMLPPREFGAYLTVSNQKRSRRQAIYFEVKSDFSSDFFNMSLVAEKCVAHADGKPKRSFFLAIYRVLEHVPLQALGNLYLATKDGRVLELAASDLPSGFADKYFLYDEICPVHPLVASSLNPVEFCRFITNPSNTLHVPRICFSDVDLYEMAAGPDRTPPPEVQHPLMLHIRNCLLELENTEKRTKTVDRTHLMGSWARRMKYGLFVGDQQGLLYFPFPSPEELETTHRQWWRSASI